MSQVLKTSLHAAHLRAGGKMVEFAGWDMPVQYEGVIAEAKAVRKSAGMFDVSHMGRTWHRGSEVRAFLETITTNDISALIPGGSQYSLMCNEQGGAVDDVIVYKVSDEVYRVVINAANRETDIDWMNQQNDRGVQITDETFETAMIAVQGPTAIQALEQMSADLISEMDRFTARDVEIDGAPAFCARTGYTGEDGVELILAAADSERVWSGLLDLGVVPCGLASRDVLRVEAGLPLYGNELAADINPIEAGLGWVCSKTKKFIGSDAVNDMRANKPDRKLVGIRMDSRIVPRLGYTVLKSGASIGTVSSGVYSPALECGIAFAFVKRDAAGLNEPCEVLIRDKVHAATMVGKRFLAKS